jgi:hypothetical protein
MDRRTGAGERTGGAGGGRAAAAVVLLLLPVYVLSSPGRVDIVDGQVRYEVARNWLDHGRPEVRDRYLRNLGLVIATPDGAYGGYNAPASLSPMPAMLLSRLLPGHGPDRDRFAFSMAGPLFGAAGAGLLVLAYTALGLPPRAAAGWALAVGLATLWWPGATTVFDQNQHAVLLLAALLLAWRAGRRRHWAPAMLGGLAGAGLLNYQENYALVLPAVGLAVLAPAGRGVAGLRLAVDRAAVGRYLLFGAVAAAGFLPLLAFNLWRFGGFFYAGRFDDPLIFAVANPVAGLLSLVLSPGKSVFLFSPPLMLAALGVRELFRRAPGLAVAVAAVSAVHVLVVVQVAFFGGDWCWGPRYLLVLLPLWALALPFAARRLARPVVIVTLAAGLVVQVLALSLDHQRFFFERDLPPHFWADDPWVYFRHSQLLARPAELAAALRDGPPRQVVAFVPSPTLEVTYAPFGPPPAITGRQWALSFAVFHLPRPWPLWVAWLPVDRRPVEATTLLLPCLLVLTLGIAVLARLPAAPGAVTAAPSPASRDPQTP